MSSSNFLDLDVDGGVPGGVKEGLGLGGGQLTGLGEIAKSDCIKVGDFFGVSQSTVVGMACMFALGTELAGVVERMLNLLDIGTQAPITFWFISDFSATPLTLTLLSWTAFTPWSTFICFPELFIFVAKVSFFLLDLLDSAVKLSSDLFSFSSRTLILFCASLLCLISF